jgi:hypothetical protein
MTGVYLMTPTEPPLDFTDNQDRYWTNDPPAENRQEPYSYTVELAREMAEMHPWYLKACRRWNLEIEGLSGITPDRITEFIVAFVHGHTPVNPCREIPLVFILKNAIADLKRVYAEGYLEQPEHREASEQDLNAWFWNETAAGRLLLELEEVCKSSPERTMNVIGENAIMAGDSIRNC